MTPEEEQDKSPWGKALQFLESRKAANPARTYADPTPEAAPKRDGDWKAILAMGLDLIANKGQGIGTIAQANENNYSKQLSDWRQRNSADAMLERQAKVQQLRAGEQALADKPLEDAHKLAATFQAEANADAAERRFGVEDARAKAFHGDDLEQHRLSREQSADQFTRSLTSSDRNAAASRGLQLRGLNQSDNHFAQQLAQARSFHDDAVQLDRDKLALSEEAAKAKAEAKTHAAIPGTKVFDKPRYQSLTPKEQSDATEAVRVHNLGLATVTKLRDLLDAASKGEGKPTDEQLYNSMIQEAIGDKSKANATGVLSNTEFGRAIAGYPVYGGDLRQAKGMKQTWDAIKGGHPGVELINDLIGTATKRSAAGLKAYGVSLDDVEAADEAAKTPANPYEDFGVKFQ